MKIIILKNNPAIGKRGDVKDVKVGYARNFLFPQKIACVFSDKILSDITSTKTKKK